jgi:hypothetical protein
MVFFVGIAVLLPVATNAVVFYSTGDASFNTTAPTGDLEGSGWQFQGRFNSYLGTPIAPHHFVTASHIGGSVGNKFYLNGTTNTTIAYIDDPDSDLRLWEIDGTFEDYAPLCTGGEAVGSSLVVFGRGVDRGDVVTNTVSVRVGGSPRNPIYEEQTVTNGWKWGAYNYTQRWGANAVSSVDDSYIIAEWDADGGENECMLTDKDSGGAVFIQEGDDWKLAGINYSISPGWTFSLSSDGTDSFNGAILDPDGVYFLYGSTWNSMEPYTSAFYASRISSSYEWITNNIADFDADVDGLPDWWESTYGETEADSDPDRDGFMNYEEWLADTLPNNSNSFLRVTDYSAATNLIFRSSTNRQYLLESCNSLSNQSWLAEGDWFSPASTQTVVSVSAAESNRFYRVRARLR